MNDRTWFQIIPIPAKVLAVLVFAGTIALASCFLASLNTVGPELLIGLVCGSFFAGFILLSGYVYADAARRGMPPVPWTALALLVPNGIGFVLYFLLRTPMVHACPSCAYGVSQSAAFCPRCGQSQGAQKEMPAQR